MRRGRRLSTSEVRAALADAAGDVDAALAAAGLPPRAPRRRPP